MNWEKEFKELDKKFIDGIAEMPEINCYFLINTIGGVVFHHHHDLSHDRLVGTTEEDIRGLRIKQSYVVQQLTRFGLEKPCEGPEKDYAPTEDYQNWFEWWHEYCQRTLSNEEWSVLNQKINNKEDISAYRPEGHW